MKTFRIILSALVLVVIGGIYMLLAPTGGSADQATNDNSTTPATQQPQSSDSGSYSGIGK